MELKGRIDEDLSFLAETEEGEIQCLLFTSAEDSEEDPEEFDLAGHEPGPVTVTCESYDGDDAWGVTEVVARAEDDDEGEADEDAGESADDEATDEDQSEDDESADDDEEAAEDEELEEQD